MRAILFPIIIGLAATCAVAQRRGTRTVPNAPDVAALEKRVSSLERRILELESKSREGDFVELDTTKDTYQRVNSTTGSFLVRVTKVTPYLDGYKVVFAIGNTTTATFNGCDLSVQWGTKEPDYSDKWITWLQSLKKKDEHFTEDLAPGRWNEIEMALVPAKPDELGYLQLSMKTNT